MSRKDLTTFFNWLLALFRTGNHRTDDLGLGITGARKRLVAMLARGQHRTSGMARASLVASGAQAFLLQNPVLFDVIAMASMLERNDELCVAYPLVAADAREYLRGAVKGALIFWNAWDDESRAVFVNAFGRSLAS